MRNSQFLAFNVLLIIFSTNAYSHVGEHNADWMQAIMHFIASPDHLPFIIPVIVILGLGIRRIQKIFIK